MADRSKYRKVGDLYVEGTELVLRDGSVIWMQTLNPFEIEDARQTAAAARSRLVLALHEEGSDELARVDAEFVIRGRERIIEDIATSRTDEQLPKFADEIRDDPEREEDQAILDREDEILARPASDAEQQVLKEVNERWLEAINKRIAHERSYQEARLEKLDEDGLREEFKQLYIDRKGGDVAVAEFSLTQSWYAARCCDAVQTDGGEWDHSECDHSSRVWDTKVEVRNLPTELQLALQEALNSIGMTEREGKDLGSRPSSSGSSPASSAEAESTPSTPAETPGEPHGS